MLQIGQSRFRRSMGVDIGASPYFRHMRLPPPLVHRMLDFLLVVERSCRETEADTADQTTVGTWARGADLDGKTLLSTRRCLSLDHSKGELRLAARFSLYFQADFQADNDSTGEASS